MITKQEWEARLDKADKGLFALYWNKHKISLNALKSYREMLKDIRRMMNHLFKVKFRSNKRVWLKEVCELNNIFCEIEQVLAVS